MPPRNREADLLRIATSWLQSVSFTGFGDEKRPLGSTNLDLDILELLHIEPSVQTREGAFYSEQEKEYALDLFKEAPGWAYKRWLELVANPK